MAIHPTAVVDGSAEIDPAAEIGPYAIIEGNVRIGAGARIYPHAFIAEGTTIGEGCQVHPFAVVGHAPQDLKYRGGVSFTRIGDETVIREQAQIHRGVSPGSSTVVGRRCFIMATGHVGHNCVLGDDVKVANGALLAGHIEVGNGVFVSGNAVAHQFSRIGELVMIGGGARVPRDVPPFMSVAYEEIFGVNVVGMRRAGFTREERDEIKSCFRIMFRSGLAFPAAIAQVVETVQTGPGRRLAEFLKAPSRRGYMHGTRPNRRGELAVDQEVS
jgi:UDP-N-acetylglucosamine acyltransferase